MQTLIYKGKLRLGPHSEGDDILFLSDLNEIPFAERLTEDVGGKRVSVRYWTSKEASDSVKADFVKGLMGIVDGDFFHQYSEITGYLWTDEYLKIGGHDLIEELKSFVGDFILLEIDVHE